MALNNQSTLIYTIVKTPRREKLFKWVRPLAESDKAYIYKLKERDDIVLTSLDDAKRYITGVVQDSMNHQYLIDNGFKMDINLDTVATAQLYNVKKLLAGRITLWVSSEKQFSHAVKDSGAAEDKFEKVMQLFELSPYMAFSRDTPDALVEKVATAYDQLVAEGLIERFESQDVVVSHNRARLSREP